MQLFKKVIKLNSEKQNSSGTIKVEKMGGKISAELDLKIKESERCILGLNISDFEFIQFDIIEGKKRYEAKTQSIGDFECECIVADKKGLPLYYGSSGKKRNPSNILALVDLKSNIESEKEKSERKDIDSANNGADYPSEKKEEEYKSQDEEDTVSLNNAFTKSQDTKRKENPPILIRKEKKIKGDSSIKNKDKCEDCPPIENKETAEEKDNLQNASRKEEKNGKAKEGQELKEALQNKTESPNGEEPKVREGKNLYSFKEESERLIKQTELERGYKIAIKNSDGEYEKAVNEFLNESANINSNDNIKAENNMNDNEEKSILSKEIAESISANSNIFLNAKKKGLIGEEENFYIAVKPQLDELFICYPKEEKLCSLIPDSSWVKINFKDDEFYVVGLVGKGPDYICYGIPATYEIEPPKDIMALCSWLPKDKNDVEGEGYWIMYQDAITGKTISRSLE